MAAVATVVAPGVPNPQMSPNSQGTSTTPGGAPGVTKRYRAAPAKTFQCRGYGDCRMVFSRSEHLARHVRKHTGERPFSCHCGKQFSRLDNLRQHAQTVHADKQDLNEKMMRELTALHTSMASSNKGGGRGKRAQQQQQQQQVMSAAIGGQPPQSAAAAAAGSSQQHTMMNVANNGANGANGQIMTVKEEEMQHPLPSNYGLGSSRLHTLSQLQLSVKVPARQQLPPTPPITPPTTIPFVTNPASPFVSPQPRHNNNNSNSNSNNINRAAAASPFSPPPHPTLSSHSTSQQLAAAAVAAAAAGHPLQVVPTHMLGPSRPSLPLSPNPSPHPNNNHPLQTAPHYFQYPHQVQEDSDPRPPLVPGQLPPHTSPTDLLSVEGLDWSLSQNYPFTATTNSPLDGWAPQQGRRGSMSPAAAAELETARHRPLQADHPTTHHFPSTHPHSPNHRPGGVGNDLTQDQTDSTNHRHHQLNGNRPQEPGQGQTSTSTVATPDLSLAGSPSWSSAMTTPHHHPHQLHQGPFYHYHPQQQPHVQTPHPGSQSGPSASHPQPPPPQPPHTPQQAHSVPTTPQEEEYMQRLAVMSQHQQQQQSRLFQLQDPQQHLHYPQRHAQEDMHHHHPHHRMQQQIPHHHVQIKYESPGLLPSQLPLLPE